MRCPSCGDEYEPGVERCADCGVPLLDPADGEVELPASVPRMDQRLGRFHPAVGDLIAQILDRRSIPHTVHPHDDGTEIVVDSRWRDDLRTEFSVSWDEMMRGLGEEERDEVRALGGSAPGWFDAPQGGYVDRAGRMIVAGQQDDDEADEARVLGPALLMVGGITVVTGWLVLSMPGVVVVGIGLAIVGLMLPR
jgi:hypothetical protein